MRAGGRAQEQQRDQAREHQRHHDQRAVHIGVGRPALRPGQIPAQAGFHAHHFSGHQHRERRAQPHEQAHEDLRQRRRYGHAQHQEPLAGAHGARHVVGAVHARHAGPGQHGDGKPGCQRDQEHRRRPAGRKEVERHRQERGRRHRSQEAQHRMHPVAQPARPADRHAGQEARRRAQRETVEQQPQRIDQAVQEPLVVRGVDLDQRLRRREEGTGQQGQLGGCQLPTAHGHRQRREPRSGAAQRLRRPGLFAARHRRQQQQGRQRQRRHAELARIAPGREADLDIGQAQRQPAHAGPQRGGDRAGLPQAPSRRARRPPSAPRWRPTPRQPRTLGTTACAYLLMSRFALRTLMIFRSLA